MACQRQFSKTILLVIILGCCLSCTLYSQEVPASSEATVVLNEIRLDNEGIRAVDTSGMELRYDFGEAKFVPVDETEENVPRGDQSQRNDADEISVEERCTRQLLVDAWENTVRVEYDQFVDDDIIAYGRVTVKGWVKGNVKSLNNRILITSTGVVDGDVVAPDVVIKSGGVVNGEIVRTGNPLDIDDLTGNFTGDGIIVVASLTAFFLVCAFLVASLMPDQLKVLHDCMSEYPARSFLLGFFLTLLVPLVVALVTITVVGVLVLPLVPLAYLAGFILGLIAFGSKITSRFLSRFGLGGTDLLSQSLIGVSFLMLFWFGVALLLGMHDPTAEGFGIALLVFSIILTAYPMATGLGAVVLTRFGYRKYTGRRQNLSTFPDSNIPVPPPIPETPPTPGSSESSK